MLRIFRNTDNNTVGLRLDTGPWGFAGFCSRIRLPEFIFIFSLCSNEKLNRYAICWDITLEVAWRYSAGMFSGPDALFELSLLIPKATSSVVIGFSNFEFS